MVIATRIDVSEEIVKYKFIWTLSPQLAPRAEITLAKLGKLTGELMPLVMNNAYTLQLSSNVASDKRVLPEQSQSNRIPAGFQPFHANQNHISTVQNKPVHVNHDVDGNKKKHLVQLLPSSRPTLPS